MMLWAIPVSQPALWSPSNSSSSSSSSSSIFLHRGRQSRICVKALQASALEAANADRYGSDTARARRVDVVLTMLQETNDVEGSLQGWDKPLSPKRIVGILNGLSRWQTALQFFEWVKARDEWYEINLITYNVMLKILRNAQQLETSEKLFQEMVNRGLEPDNFTFSTLISCAKRCEKPELALKWFEKMKAAKVVPDFITYNTVIDLYGRLGRVKEAVELYNKLRSLNWKVDTITYGTLANVYSRSGDYRAIMDLVAEMKTSGQKPNAVIMNTLLATLCKAERCELAMATFSDMKSYGLSPTPFTITILMDMFNRRGLYDQAAELYESTSAKGEGWKPDAMVYNSVLRGLVDEGNVQKAEDILKEMKEIGCEPNSLSYKTVMNVYASKGMVDSAKEMFDKAVELTGKPDTTLYTVMVRACKFAGDFKRVREVFDEMVEKGCLADERFSAMLMTCMALAGNGEERQCILDCLRRSSPSLYELLVSVTMHTTDEADVLIENFALGYPASPCRKALFNSLIETWCNTGMTRAATRVFSGGISVGAFGPLQTKSPGLWQLDVRNLTYHTAQFAIEAWFRTLALAVEDEDELPEKLIIQTGIGRAGAIQNLKTLVAAFLKKIEAPFAKETDHFSSSGTAVEAWIKSKGRSLETSEALPVLET